MNFLLLSILFTSIKGYNFVIFLNEKIKRINNTDLFSQPHLLIFKKGVNINEQHCVCVYVYINICIYIYIYIYNVIGCI